jgi:hypothetical protein
MDATAHAAQTLTIPLGVDEHLGSPSVLIALPTGRARYNQIRRSYEHQADTADVAFADGYSQIRDARDARLELVSNLGRDILADVIERTVGNLINMGVFSLNPESFRTLYCTPHLRWGDTLDKLAQAIGSDAPLSALPDEAEALDSFCYDLSCSIWGLHYAHIKAVNALLNAGICTGINARESQQAGAIFDNIDKGRLPPDKIPLALSACLSLSPYEKYVYDYMLKAYPHASVSIFQTADFFGISYPSHQPPNQAGDIQTSTSTGNLKV